MFNTHAKIRLQKFYISIADKEKKKLCKEIISLILTRRIPASNFIEWKDYKIVYQRYANLFFCCLVDWNDNELISLEIIQRYVEILDSYFGNVRLKLLRLKTSELYFKLIITKGLRIGHNIQLLESSFYL